jgi:Cys-rich repeat protein
MVCSGDALRMRLPAIVALGIGLAVVLASQTARAVTFPQDPQWIPLTCNGQVVTDVAGEVQPPAIDAVGDPSDPAAYFFMDGTSLFLRLRMNATVQQNANQYLPYAWACLIRTPTTPDSYLVWDGVDGIANPNAVELLQNAQPVPGDPTQQPANTVVATYTIATNAREVAATSNIGGNPNVFIDWAVALSDLATAGITPSTPLTFICGTSKTERVLDADVIGDEQGCFGGVLDPVQCNGGSCSTCATANACGPSCTACSGATPACNPAVGCTEACTSSAQCGGLTPVCDTTRGVCVGCTSDASCPSGTTCNTASGLCIGCTPSVACPVGTLCDTASGTCTPCPPGAACPGGGGGSSSGGNNVLADGSIEGGSCACDAVGGGSSPGGLAGLALGIAAALRARARWPRRRA